MSIFICANIQFLHADCGVAFAGKEQLPRSQSIAISCNATLLFYI